MTAVLEGTTPALVHLSFPGNFTSGTNYQLTVNGVKDLAGNAIANGSTHFTYFAPYTPKQYDVVIDEIMADPSPQVALPNYEWIELRNTSGAAINLAGWKIGDATSESGPMSSYLLPPDSFVIVLRAPLYSLCPFMDRRLALPVFLRLIIRATAYI